MENKTICITGANGFIGAELTRVLLNNGFSIIAIKRSNSDLWRCDFCGEIRWLNIEMPDWKTELINIRPQIFIHCAWHGVSAKDRNDWGQQSKNIGFLLDIIGLAQECNAEKIISLGSQAEYGLINGKITEEYSLIPNTAYGAIKLACKEILEASFNGTSTRWYWLRLFSFFGEREADNWLIPSCIIKMLTGSEMDLTEGKQQYAYLHVNDLVMSIADLMQSNAISGVYNISSDSVYPLKNIVEHIAKIVNPDFKLNFGAIPYRDGQSMHVEGDISKFEREVGPIDTSNFYEKLTNTALFIKKRYEERITNC